MTSMLELLDGTKAGTETCRTLQVRPDPLLLLLSFAYASVRLKRDCKVRGSVGKMRKLKVSSVSLTEHDLKQKSEHFVSQLLLIWLGCARRCQGHNSPSAVWFVYICPPCSCRTAPPHHDIADYLGTPGTSRA